MNLGHPFLIFRLRKKVEVPLEDNEAWIHPIKVIVVKKNKPGVPRPDEVYDSGHEPSDEDNLKAYQTLFGMRKNEHRDVGQSSTHPPLYLSHEEDDSGPSPSLEGQVLDLTTRFDALWDGLGTSSITKPRSG